MSGLWITTCAFQGPHILSGLGESNSSEKSPFYVRWVGTAVEIVSSWAPLLVAILPGTLFPYRSIPPVGNPKQIFWGSIFDVRQSDRTKLNISGNGSRIRQKVDRIWEEKYSSVGINEITGVGRRITDLSKISSALNRCICICVKIKFLKWRVLSFLIHGCYAAIIWMVGHGVSMWYSG